MRSHWLIGFAQSTRRDQDMLAVTKLEGDTHIWRSLVHLLTSSCGFGSSLHLVLQSGLALPQKIYRGDRSSSSRKLASSVLAS